MPHHHFHLSLNCSNLEYSVGFYRVLFGVEPSKWFPDYAKFELAEPALVLSLEPAKTSGQGTLNHLGIRVEKKETIQLFEERLKSFQIPYQYLNEIECCYSKQNKIVFRDPDQNLVEIYTLEQELERKGSNEKTASLPNASERASESWEHLVGTLLPDDFDFPEKSLQEVRLRGSFNQRENFERALPCLKKLRSKLAEGGQILLHHLVGNREVLSIPDLPPPADAVKYVPQESQLIDLLEKAGFALIQIKRLSSAPVMQLGDVELRELLITGKAIEKNSSETAIEVIYQGPLARLVDDFGNIFERGQRVSVDGKYFKQLQETTDAKLFVTLTAGSQCKVDV